MPAAAQTSMHTILVPPTSHEPYLRAPEDGPIGIPSRQRFSWATGVKRDGTWPWASGGMLLDDRFGGVGGAGGALTGPRGS
jgi:hypothetical protein